MTVLERDVRGSALTAEDIAAIARHEHLTQQEAAIRGSEFLSKPWGHAAIRQMIWDNLVEARRHGHDGTIASLTDLYRQACRRFPSTCDRRTSPTRARHPFPLRPGDL